MLPLRIKDVPRRFAPFSRLNKRPCNASPRLKELISSDDMHAANNQGTLASRMNVFQLELSTEISLQHVCKDTRYILATAHLNA
mmetsp:Transcript_19255/g.32140  ORF Transcript_19255/g.32140 Transcript_19255/m.32140 type:complete len:84 (+) Transcript_19255:2218-2469(+)